MNDPKYAWKFDQNVSADNRSPRALEHIAYYLDRIDTQLERIAAALERGNMNSSNIAGTLTHINSTLQTRR